MARVIYGESDIWRECYMARVIYGESDIWRESVRDGWMGTKIRVYLDNALI